MPSINRFAKPTIIAGPLLVSSFAFSATAYAQGLQVLVTERDPETGALVFRGAAVDDGDGGSVAVNQNNAANARLEGYETATTVPFETSVAGTPTTSVMDTALIPPGSRAGLIEDFFIGSNLQNPSVANGLTVSFAGADGAPAAIVNGPGVDLIVIELSPPAGVIPPSGGPTVLGGDPTLITIPSGASLEVLSDAFAQFGGNGFTGPLSFFTAAGDPISSLAELEDPDALAFLINVPGLNVYGTGIDLSDLGVADGASITQAQFNSIAATGFGPDFGLIAGVPQDAPQAIIGGELQLSAFGPITSDFTFDLLSPQGGAPAFDSVAAPLFTSISIDATDPLVQSVTGDFLLDGSVPLSAQALPAADYITTLLGAGVTSAGLPGLVALSDLGANGLDLGLRAFSPEIYANAPGIIAAEAADLQTRALRDAFDRAHHRGTQVGGIALWSDVFGGWQETDGDADFGTSDFDSDVFGLLFGLDYQLSERVLVGVHGGFVEGEGELEQGNFELAEYEQETGSVGVHGLFHDGGLRVGGAFTYSFGDGEFERQLPGTSGVFAEGEADADHFVIYGDVAYETDYGGFTIVPQLTATYVSLDRDDVVETGTPGFALAVEPAEDFEALFLAPQIAIARDFGSGDTVIRPDVRVGWRFDVIDDGGEAFAALFDVPPISAFRVGAAELEDSAFFGGAGLTAAIGDSISLFVRYEGTFAGDLEAHDVSGGLTVAF